MTRRKKHTLVFILLFAICGALFFFQEADALVKLQNPLGGEAGNEQGLVDIRDIMGNVIRVILGITGSAALVMFVIGAFQWMTAAGEEKKVENGWNTMTWATLGLAVILGSYALVEFVLKAVNISSSSRQPGTQQQSSQGTNTSTGPSESSPSSFSDLELGDAELDNLFPSVPLSNPFSTQDFGDLNSLGNPPVRPEVYEVERTATIPGTSESFRIRVTDDAARLLRLQNDRENIESRKLKLTDKGLESVTWIDTTKDLADPARYRKADLNFALSGTKEVTLKRADESPSNKKFLLEVKDIDGSTHTTLIGDDGFILEQKDF